MKIVMRTGFVRVASSQGDRIYKSLDDLPETLRERARRTLDGPNADTILIADPEAYEWILEMGEGLPTEIQRARPPRTREKPKRTAAKSDADREWKVLLFAGGGAILTLWALWLWAIRSGMS